jgi:hypothetical protein
VIVNSVGPCPAKGSGGTPVRRRSGSPQRSHSSDDAPLWAERRKVGEGREQHLSGCGGQFVQMDEAALRCSSVSLVPRSSDALTPVFRVVTTEPSLSRLVMRPRPSW